MTDTDTTKAPRKAQLIDNHKGTKVTFWMDPNDLVIDGLDNDVEIDPYNAQRLKAPLVEEDVLSILRNGVLVPVLVLVRKFDDGSKQTVVHDGRQRVRRARAANERIEAHNSGKMPLPWVPDDVVLEKITVLCLPGKVASDLDAVLESVAANTGRLNDGPRTMAQTAIWLAAAGATDQQIAAAMARDAQTVKDYLALGNASSKVMAALDAGDLDATAACRLAAMPKDKQNEELARLSDGGTRKITKEAATVAAKKHKAEAKGKKAKQVEERRTVRELRLTQRGLQAAIAEGDARSREHAENVALLTAVNFVLGEEYPDVGDGKEIHARLMSMTKIGARLKAKEDKAKGRPGKEKE